ncbi:MAG: AAA family ATPase [Caulobacteraceae bacterium]|nr:AAA family ATPase [Caulobacteraceae bacterium]
MRSIDAEHYWLEARFERREGWDDGVYPFNLPVLRKTETITFHPRVTFLVGENGAGKSTLIEALAVAWGFNPEGGNKNFGFDTRASHSPLHRFVRPVRSTRRAREGFFLRAESYFNLATEIERLDSEWGGPPVAPSFGKRALHEQSHGESFMALMDNKLHGDGLYIFDEPEAALSPTRQLTFLARLNELVNQRSQFIIATHSPIILGYPNAWIYQVSDHGVDRIEYEDTDHYQVTRNFLLRREMMLDVLMKE